MSLESDLFERLHPVREKLLAYGFLEEESRLIYRTPLAIDSFSAVITVENGKLCGQVIDEEGGDEYVAVHLQGHLGPFAASVRSAYLDILEDIARSCFRRSVFLSAQTERIAEKIQKAYGDGPEFIFEKFPGYAVFRHEGSGKWYALIMNVSGNALDGRDEETEVINVKADIIESLFKKKGFFPAFHMSRKTWCSMILDDTLDDSEVMAMVEGSRRMTAGKKAAGGAWLIPANPKYFDVDHAFSVSDVLHWKQSSSVCRGDLVYMYYGAPYSEIRYLCEVTETDIPFKGVNDGPVKFTKLMKIRKLRMFEGGKISRSLMEKYGVRAVRSARRMPEELIAEIGRIYGTETEKEK